ncbi:hypothetical protein BJV77DRAFT_966630 [Russula vinacea]|nr:hypothetical protein BJV77DRAFT_966630 [Russula vinacea]
MPFEAEHVSAKNWESDNAPPMWQHAWKCAQQRLRARSPMQWSGGMATHDSQPQPHHTTLLPTSSDHVPSPPHQIALKLGQNIEHGLYDGSPVNQGAATPDPPQSHQNHPSRLKHLKICTGISDSHKRCPNGAYCKAQEWVLTDWAIAPDQLVGVPPKLVDSPVWLELPVLESVLMPGGTLTSRSQAASGCSIARTVGTWCITKSGLETYTTRGREKKDEWVTIGGGGGGGFMERYMRARGKTSTT